MTLRHSVFRSVFQPVRSDVFVQEATSRYFTNFSAAATSYVQLPSVINTGTGDFYTSVSISPTGNNFYIFGYSLVSATTNDRLLINSSNQLTGFGFTTNSLSNTAWITDGKLHLVECYRVSGIVYFDVDGVNLASVSDASAFIFDRVFGKYGGATLVDTFDGYGINASCSVSGVEILDMPLYESHISNLTANNLVNPSNNGTYVNITSADAELFTLNTSTSPSQWENSDKSIIIPVAY